MSRSLRPTVLVFALLPIVLTALAARADQDLPPRLPADHDTFIYVADPLPHLRRVLSSEALRKTLLEGKLREGLQAFDRGAGAPDPRQALDPLEQNAQFVPSGIFIGLPSSALADVADLIRLSVAGGLLNGAQNVDEPDERTIESLQKEVVAAIKDVRVPKLTVYVEFRSPAVPQIAWQGVLGFAQQMQGSGMATIDIREDSIRAGTRLLQLLPEEALVAMLVELGLLTGEDDPQAETMVTALDDIELELALERFDDGLRVTLGSAPEEKTAMLRPQDLGPLWPPDQPLIVFGRWNIRDFRKEIDRAWALWQKWENTPVGKATAELDEEGLIIDLRDVVRSVQGTAPTGTFRVTAGDGLAAAIRSEDPPPAQPLSETGLLQWTPATKGIVVLDSTRSVADHLIAQVSRFEERMEINSLKYELSDRQRQAELLEALRTGYYERLGEFRKLVYETAPTVFEPPLAVLVDAQGTVDRLELQFEDQGEKNRITAREMPIFEYAVIGRLKDPKKESLFVRDLWESFIGAFVEVEPPLVGPVDLGLGVPTAGFRGDWWRKLPGNVEITVEGDLTPHYFQQDGWFVFSTSPRLSRQILQARGRAADRLKLPSADDGTLVAVGVMPSDTIAALFEHFGEWTSDLFTKSEGKVRLEGPVFAGEPAADTERFGLVFEGVAEIIRLAGTARWHTVDRDDVRITRFQLPLGADETLQ